MLPSINYEMEKRMLSHFRKLHPASLNVVEE